MTTPQEPQATPQAPYHPSLRDMLMLSLPSAVRISPDGTCLAFTVQVTNWQDDCYESICYIYDLDSGLTTPLTRKGGVAQMSWIDDHTLAVRRQSGWDGGGPQVRIYENLVGEGWQVTHHEGGVKWSEPFAGGILYQADDPERAEQRARNDLFGQFTHFEQEASVSALYYVGLSQLRAYEAQARASTEDEAKRLLRPVVELSRLLEEPLSIQSVVPSPTGDAIYLTCRTRDDLVYYRETSSYRIAVNPDAALDEHLRRESEKQRAGKEGTPAKEGDTVREDPDASYLGSLTRLATPRGAHIVAVSPDGRKLLVGYQGRDLKMYTREDLWVIDVDAAVAAADAEDFTAAMRNLTASLDRTVVDQGWFDCGILALYADGTVMRAAHLHEDGTVAPIDFGGIHPTSGLHASTQGRLAFVGASALTVPEVYVADLAPAGCCDGEGQCRVQPTSVTDVARALDVWDLGTVETITWESRDGTIIEGVLRKPSDFDPSRRYPLVLVVHGGPSWLSTEVLISGEDLRTYPSVQFADRDVLVLKPNYRGSIGRGQAFVELNVNNLGVGDLWDIESAVDHLVALGHVDPDRVGCMGWSQGGYISAFAGLHSGKFRAVSVGAGISDWYTYHVSNDIPDFTLDYLSGSPFRDRARYVETAPISALAKAHTPMLIQHGSDDHRVPLSNAMELYRGLKEMGVPVELYIYPGMGHPITKPRENHAVMHQNFAWFCHYLLDEDIE